MFVQFPIRWSDRKQLSEEEELARKAIDGEDKPDDIEYSYGNVILDIDDIRGYNDIDENHCIIRTYQNDSYCIALRFEDLKNIMTELTGKSITIIAKKEIGPKKEKKTKKKDNDDDIII